MKCKFCESTDSYISAWNKNVIDHLIITKDSNNHVHVHGDLDDKEKMKDYISIIQKEAKLEPIQHTINVVPPTASDAPPTCIFCKNNTPRYEWTDDVVSHIVLTMDNNRHIHVHGNLDNKEIVKELIDTACDHAEIPNTNAVKEPINTVPDKIVFKNRQAIGDILTMTCLYNDSPILLADGSTRQIGKIVRGNEQLFVKSFNPILNTIENKKIINWVKNKEVEDNWYFLSYVSAPISQRAQRLQGVYLTADHKVLTSKGMIRVDSICSNDKIITNERALNKLQKQVFVGTILGDSYLIKTKTKGRAYFAYTHAVKQKEFKELKDKAFNGLVHSIYHTKGGIVKGKNHQDTVSSQYRTSAEFGYLHTQWYSTGKKALPKKINKDDFSWLTLAVWYMDDGALNTPESGMLCSDALSKQDNERLKNILNQKFNLEIELMPIKRQGTSIKYRLYIGNKHRYYKGIRSSDIFFSNIAPYVPDSMKYKIPAKFRNIKFDKTLWDLGTAENYNATPIVQKKTAPNKNHAKYSYCIEVEDNHNFISNNLILSNCGVRDFHAAYPKTEIGVITTAMHIWDNNPYINHQLRDENLIVNIGPGSLTNRSNRDNRHMCNAFRVSMEEQLKIQIPQGPIYPDIWMTQEERDRKPLIDGQYWIIVVSGEPGWPVKMYHRWQEVVDMLPDIKFVQIGLQKQNFTRLQNNKGNIIDYIGKTEDKDTGIRDLFNLFLHAHGSVGLISMHMHLSAAFQNPCVCVAGAREPSWFTQYLGHQYISTNGCLPCAEYNACWKCKMEGCIGLQEKHGMEVNKEVPPCVGIIEPEEVAEGIKKYYKGGLLKKNEPKKITFKNIVKEKKVFVQPAVDNAPAEKYGFTWGGGSLTDRDWTFIQKVIDTYSIKSVLEFGAGLSTLLFSEKVESVTTYETQAGWIKKIKEQAGKNVDLRLWDGKVVKEELPKYDMVFVDGPAGGANREISTKISSQLADVVIVHDANREYEKKWQSMYLSSDFSMTSKGGHRCHLWIRNKGGKVNRDIEIISTGNKIATPTQVMLNTTPTNNAPDIRIISTARGGGGQFRSITTMMKLLMGAGHKVEFVPFHSKYEVGKGIGRDWMSALTTELKDVVIRDWSVIKEPTKMTFVYTDDFVWEFSKPEMAEAFSDMKSDRRMMFINYRLGSIGKIEWTQNWDHYGALNSTIIKNLEAVYPECIGNTSVRPPCTDLTLFLETQPNYDDKLRIVRHSSQGNVKYSKTFNDELTRIHEIRPDATIRLMPPPDFCMDAEYVIKHKKNQPSVPTFLSLGNLYWYSTPIGYLDAGPRVALEAMASGLGIVADSGTGGMDDRVIHGETGYLCKDKEEHAEYMKNLSSSELKRLGEASKQRAIDNWGPEKWVSYLMGE